MTGLHSSLLTSAVSRLCRSCVVRCVVRTAGVVVRLAGVLSVALKWFEVSARIPRIVCMFDVDVAGLDQLGGLDASGMSAAQLAECVVDTHRLLQSAGCQMLQLAAAWADC